MVFQAKPRLTVDEDTGEEMDLWGSTEQETQAPT